MNLFALGIVILEYVRTYLVDLIHRAVILTLYKGPTIRSLGHVAKFTLKKVCFSVL